MKCSGLYSDGCRRGGGGLAALVVLPAVIAAAACHVQRGIEAGLEITRYVLGGLAVIALAVGTVNAAVRIRARVIGVRASAEPAPVRSRVIQFGTEMATGKAIEAPQRRGGNEPLPSWREELRSRIGGDGQV